MHGALDTIEDQHEELSVAQEELRAQIEALEAAAGDMQRERALRERLERALAGPAPIVADRVRILQIVSNLLSNAIKYTPKGGRVRICVRHEPPHAVLEVEDDGNGIEAATLPERFEAYRQAGYSAHARSGLGLDIVRRLVELHRGTVHATSDGPGRGARFTVRLPLAVDESPMPSGTSIAADEKLVGLDALCVLVVDDNPDERDRIATMLASHGARVVVAGDASQALAVFDACAPDVVVSDLEMPGEEDGFALVRRMRARVPRVPAIAVSGLARPSDVERARAAGFEAHLAKPIEARELVARVRELARRGR